MAFKVEKEIELVAADAPNTHGLIRSLTPKSIASFKKSAIAQHNYGVYVFGLRNSGGTTKPWYIGLAKQQTFSDESMTRDKLRKYSAAMFSRAGTPTITLVSWCPPDNENLIDDLERLLIWIAREKNPLLLNERKVSSSPKSIISLVNKLEISGVLNRGAGKPSNAAKAFMDLMGIA